MRRTLIATVLLAVLALIGPASSAQTGGEGEQDYGTLNITKVVDGDGPVGGYVIDFVCDLDIVGSPGEGGFGGSLDFDAAGPGSPETQVVDVPGPGNCNVTETDANGADTTTYACEFVPGPIPDSPDGAATEGDAGGCLDDQSTLFVRFGDAATITVTNTFEADVLPDDDEPPAVDDDVVDATPPFTG